MKAELQLPKKHTVTATATDVVERLRKKWCDVDGDGSLVPRAGAMHDRAFVELCGQWYCEQCTQAGAHFFPMF